MADKTIAGRTISRRDLLKLAGVAGIGGMALPLPLFGQDAQVKPLPAGPPVPCVPCSERDIFRRVTLEMSLKPFHQTDKTSIRTVCERAFHQWAELTSRVDSCAVMLWTADGSEILVYGGQMHEEIEWGRYIGIANPPVPPPKTSPSKISLHQQARLYTKHPAKITYGILKQIVETFKTVGRSMTGKPVVVGATFDPGPEFARSPFKYERHREILRGMWVDCTATLNGDSRHYAGFPHGIPQGTPFGTFFGRQCQLFLTDLGFDYIWFSNGFGFSASAWTVRGPLFNGKTFYPQRADEIRKKTIGFWKDFRKECPSFPIETRGSNLSTGADLSESAVPLEAIYDGGFNMVAPPNSPWAAIDGDCGLELTGYLSHIAHLPPGDKIPFRFYVNDPWWLNSPWFDRYDREPYDIYLPLALARLNHEGKVTPPAYIEFLTIDNSYGEMPVEAPIEISPYVIRAMDDFSDAPGLVTWVYPFHEFNEKVFGKSPRLGEVFFSDWFMRNAVNAGLPVNTIVSTENFLSSARSASMPYKDTILLTYAPEVGSALDEALLDLARSGHEVFFYGPMTHASGALLDELNLKLVSPLSGELEIKTVFKDDKLSRGKLPNRMLHREVTSGGGIDTVLKQEGMAGVEVCATVSQGANERVFAVTRKVGSGRLAWVRGSLSSHITHSALPQPDDPNRFLQVEYLMRYMLEKFGYKIIMDKPMLEARNPVMLVARSNNGFFFSGYSPDTIVSFRLRFPNGAPILQGYETWLKSGYSSYTMPRAWHRECRCFVEQAEDGQISCVEVPHEVIGLRRRFLLKGLKDATVHFYPELRPAGPPVQMAIDASRTWNLGYLNESYGNFTTVRYSSEDSGRHLIVRGVTGVLRISW